MERGGSRLYRGRVPIRWLAAHRRRHPIIAEIRGNHGRITPEGIRQRLRVERVGDIRRTPGPRRAGGLPGGPSRATEIAAAGTRLGPAAAAINISVKHLIQRRLLLDAERQKTVERGRRRRRRRLGRRRSKVGIRRRRRRRGKWRSRREATR